jgi:hypothetical protein
MNPIHSRPPSPHTPPSEAPRPSVQPAIDEHSDHATPATLGSDNIAPPQQPSARERLDNMRNRLRQRAQEEREFSAAQRARTEAFNARMRAEPRARPALENEPPSNLRERIEANHRQHDEQRRLLLGNGGGGNPPPPGGRGFVATTGDAERGQGLTGFNNSGDLQRYGNQGAERTHNPYVHMQNSLNLAASVLRGDDFAAFLAPVNDGVEGISTHTQPPEYGHQAHVDTTQSDAAMQHAEENLARHADEAERVVESHPDNPVSDRGNERGYDPVQTILSAGSISTAEVIDLVNGGAYSGKTLYDDLHPKAKTFYVDSFVQTTASPLAKKLIENLQVKPLDDAAAALVGEHKRLYESMNRSKTTKNLLKTGAGVAGDVMLGGLPSIITGGYTAKKGYDSFKSLRESSKAKQTARANASSAIGGLEAGSLGSLSRAELETVEKRITPAGLQRLLDTSEILHSSMGNYATALKLVDRGLLDGHDKAFENAKVPKKAAELITSFYRWNKSLELLREV